MLKSTHHRSVKCPFPICLTKSEELQLLIADLRREYTREKRNALIPKIGHVVMNIVSNFAWHFRNKKDDLICEGFKFAIEVLDDIAIKGACTHENYVGYFTMTVRGRLSDWVEEDFVVRIPKSTQYVNGYIKPVLAPELELYKLQNRPELNQEVTPETISGFSGELLKIIQLKLAEYTDDQVALILKISRVTLWRRKTEIRKKILAASGRLSSSFETGIQLAANSATVQDAGNQTPGTEE